MMLGEIIQMIHFDWEEAYITLPFNTNKLLIAGRINDTYGTPFYGSNGIKLT